LITRLRKNSGGLATYRGCISHDETKELLGELEYYEQVDTKQRVISLQQDRNSIFSKERVPYMFLSKGFSHISFVILLYSSKLLDLAHPGSSLCFFFGDLLKADHRGRTVLKIALLDR